MIDIRILALRLPIANAFSSSRVIDKNSFKMPSIAIFSYSIPKFSAILMPWSVSSVGVVADGSTSPNTFSFPNASQARYAESVESIPPLKPTTIPLVFDSLTLDLMNPTRSILVFSKSISGIMLMFSPT